MTEYACQTGIFDKVRYHLLLKYMQVNLVKQVFLTRLDITCYVGQSCIRYCVSGIVTSLIDITYQLFQCHFPSVFGAGDVVITHRG